MTNTDPTPARELSDRLDSILHTLRDLTAKMAAVLPPATTDRE